MQVGSLQQPYSLLPVTFWCALHDVYHWDSVRIQQHTYVCTFISLQTLGMAAKPRTLSFITQFHSLLSTYWPITFTYPSYFFADLQLSTFAFTSPDIDHPSSDNSTATPADSHSPSASRVVTSHKDAPGKENSFVKLLKLYATKVSINLVCPVTTTICNFFMLTSKRFWRTRDRYSLKCLWPLSQHTLLDCTCSRN